MKALPLPSIPFGAAGAASFAGEAACGEFLAQLPDAPSRFGAIGPGADFRVKLRNVPLSGVSLVAGASTPKATDHCSRRLALVIPFGRCETVLRAANGDHRWAAPHHAFFIPAGDHIGAESTAGAFLRLDIVEDALVRTAAGMAGQVDRRRGVLDLHTPRPVSLRVGDGSWLSAIRSLCDSVDALDCDAARIEAAGLGDVVLRTVALMLRPDLFLDRRWNELPTKGFDLDPLLEMIVARLGGRVTLADMEAWSGRASRTLQVAFQKRFGMGPMAWLRERRLDAVHARLLAAPVGATVSGIARECGMGRMATLIPEYVRRFGERPSETLRRSRK